MSDFLLSCESVIQTSYFFWDIAAVCPLNGHVKQFFCSINLLEQTSADLPNPECLNANLALMSAAYVKVFVLFEILLMLFLLPIVLRI